MTPGANKLFSIVVGVLLACATAGCAAETATTDTTGEDALSTASGNGNDNTGAPAASDPAQVPAPPTSGKGLVSSALHRARPGDTVEGPLPNPWTGGTTGSSSDPNDDHHKWSVLAIPPQ